MRAVLIDDERLALRQLEMMLQEWSGIQIVGTYIEVLQALEIIAELKPEVVFIDIQMPEINGLDAAERIYELSPETNIVFVTAYNEYAVQAFELNAMDYVLKPLQRQRLQLTVQRLEQRISIVERTATDSMHIRCFQTFQIELPARTSEPIRWRTTKAQELFFYLFHSRGQWIRKGVLLDLFWPEMDLKKAATSLYTTIYQIRQSLKKAMGNSPVRILSVDDGYMLDMKDVTIDVMEWENELRQLDKISEKSVSEHQRLMDLYRGDYLGDYDFLWAEGERQRLRMLWAHHAQSLADFYASRGLTAKAITVHHRIIQLNPYSEESYYALMKLYDVVQERAAVEEQYRRLMSVLMDELDLEPSSAITEWYTNWKKQ
jgi:two-component system LytT family response regulator